MAEKVKPERKGKTGESSLIQIHLIPFKAELVREK